MANILIIYSTTDGHTRKICRLLKQVMEERGQQVTLVSIDDDPDMSPEPFDKVLIGASIRYGRHRRQVHAFIRKNRALLDSKPSAFFSVNVVARKAEKSRPETNPYMLSFLRQTSWRPGALAVFAGKIDYRKYGFWDRQIIRLIMWITKGPTDPGTVAEFTNWDDVEAFGKHVCDM